MISRPPRWVQHKRYEDHPQENCYSGSNYSQVSGGLTQPLGNTFIADLNNGKWILRSTPTICLWLGAVPYEDMNVAKWTSEFWNVNTLSVPSRCIY